MFRSNYDPISYHLQDKWQYLQNFPTPVLNAPPRGFALEFYKNGVARKKTRMMPLPECQKNCDAMSIYFDTVLTSDRQTDRWTELVKQYPALHALHADIR